MAIILPVISHLVDKIVLDFLSQNQYVDHLSTSNGANENNNNNIDENDENNNNKSSQDEFEEVCNWADEPWTPCENVEVPDWAKLEDQTFDDIKSELVWAEDPWVQVPLVGLPSWMILPGIDYPIEAEVPVEDTPVDNGEDDAEFLASGIDVVNWSDEPYFQSPLDVPRWALLPCSLASTFQFSVMDITAPTGDGNWIITSTQGESLEGKCLLHDYPRYERNRLCITTTDSPCCVFLEILGEEITDFKMTATISSSFLPLQYVQCLRDFY